MIVRHAQSVVADLLGRFPVVALVGPRQVGKTTLARALVAGRTDVVYLDLERPSDAARLVDPELYLTRVADSLVVLDEVQAAPGLFPVLRALVDLDRRPGRYLLLGSAAPALLQRSAESLAGRIVYHELTPFTWPEVARRLDQEIHWFRGGFPDALLAPDEAGSTLWREAFLRSLVERDLPLMGLESPPLLLHRFLTMLAHRQGALWNASDLGASLGLSGRVVARYRDYLEGAFLVRCLPPFHVNGGKRLVKASKVYHRDSGLLHSLLQIASADALHGHPILGASFEGYVVEQVCSTLKRAGQVAFYRTHGGAEIDLVIHDGVRARAVIEVKYASDPRPTRGFHEARADLGDPPAWVVHPGEGRWPLAKGVEVMGVAEFLATRPDLH